MTLAGYHTPPAENVEIEPLQSLLDALSFRIARLAAINERMAGQIFRSEFGISLNDWRVIGITGALQPVTFSAVRELLYFDKGQLSRVIRSLSDRNLIVSNTSSSDARQIELRLTEAGETVHREALRFTAKRNAIMTSVFTADERSEFRRLIDKLVTHNVEKLEKSRAK